MLKASVVNQFYKFERGYFEVVGRSILQNHEYTTGKPLYICKDYFDDTISYKTILPNEPVDIMPIVLNKLSQLNATLDNSDSVSVTEYCKNKIKHLEYRYFDGDKKKVMLASQQYKKIYPDEYERYMTKAIAKGYIKPSF